MNDKQAEELIGHVRTIKIMSVALFVMLLLGIACDAAVGIL